jgi:hypothetical protein
MTAPITDTVSMDITEDTVGVSRLGFGTPMLVSYTASFPERVRTYNSLADVAVDFPTTTSFEYLAAQILFSQSPKPKQLKIGRGALAPTQVATIAVAAVRNSHAYTINVKGDGVTSTEISSSSDSAAQTPEIHNALVTALNAVVNKNFTAAFASLVFADIVFTAANATEIFTSAAHGLQTGDGPFQVSNSGGALPTGLTAVTDYWIIRIDANTFYLATSLANALAGTHLSISTDGTGTQTLADTASTKRPSDPFTVTGNAAGEWFSLEVNRDDLALSLTHADPGIATDLAAIVLEDSDWYCLLTPCNSRLQVEAAAAWVEANNRLYFVDIVNTLTITAAVGGAGEDIADRLHTSAYKRTAPFYHSSAAAMPAVGAAGRYLPTEPGSAIVKFKALAGITPVSLTATHRVNLRAKCCNWLERSGGLNIVFDGRVSAGGGSGWVDVTRDLDYVKDDLQVRIFGALASADKVDHDDDGYGVIEAELRAGLDNAVDRRIFRPGYSIEIPLRADMSDSDLAARNLPDVKWSASLRGAVQSVDVDGTVTL